MGRVEETNKALTEVENAMAKTLDNVTSKEIATAVTIAGMSAVNAEIAKSLAQLADDIHSLREKITKWLEEDEEAGPTCIDCKYHGTMNDFDWCRHKNHRIDFDDKPICNYFKPVEAES